MLYGDGKPYTICLVVPDMEMAQGYANELDLTVSPEDLIQQKDVQNLISKEIRAHLKVFKSNPCMMKTLNSV
jgi:long-chain acyl-CoA synthetase